MNCFYLNFFVCNIYLGRSVGVGPIRRPADRKIDTSPYNSGNIAYLSPPSDPSWRRTSSDSAIHQSLHQNQVCWFYLSAKLDVRVNSLTRTDRYGYICVKS